MDSKFRMNGMLDSLTSFDTLAGRSLRLLGFLFPVLPVLSFFACSAEDDSSGSATPDLGATVEAAVSAALPTETPTPTADINATITAGMIATEESQPTARPTQGPTPDIDATVEATIAALPTPTPTVPPPPIPTLSPTAAPTATPTPTPRPTATRRPTRTPIPTKSPAELLSETVKQARPAVVRIEGRTSTGSGAIFETQGSTAFVITNQHVVDGAAQVNVTVNDSATYRGTVLGTDAIRDLAVVRICCGSFSKLSFGDASGLQPGDEVVAIGYALGLSG